MQQDVRESIFFSTAVQGKRFAFYHVPLKLFLVALFSFRLLPPLRCLWRPSSSTHLLSHVPHHVQFDQTRHLHQLWKSVKGTGLGKGLVSSPLRPGLEVHRRDHSNHTPGRENTNHCCDNKKRLKTKSPCQCFSTYWPLTVGQVCACKGNC